jgi:transcriptional regulator NrdR family protein
MSEMAKCSKCGERFKRVERIYREKVKAHPELLKREPVKKPIDEKTAQMYNDMEFRLKNDPMYMWHLKKSFFGTESEKRRESQRANQGYYEKHNDFQIRKWR